MNKSIAWIVLAVVVVLGGGYWWWSSTQSAAPATGPSQTAGINGSPNQGNMGQPDNPSTNSGQAGTPQQPGATSSSGDGTGVSQNFALGTNSNASVGGTYLDAFNGMTVYTYDKDTAGKSTCTGTCAQNWPPYTVPAGSTLNLQAGIMGAISTIKRADGTLQVTYKGKPLYFYVGDKTSADVNGNGVGGVWHVVKP